MAVFKPEDEEAGGPNNPRGQVGLMWTPNPNKPQVKVGEGAASRRREFRQFDDTPSPSVLKRLLKGEGGAAE